MVEKKFNIEEAQQISQGKKLGSIKTRDGFRVTILVWNLRPAYPIGGIVHLGDDNDYLREWTAEGKSDIRPNVTMASDIILEVEGGEV